MERAEQIEVASTALGNIFAMLPEGESAEFDVRRVGRLTLRAVRAHVRPAGIRQTRDATMDGRERAASEAVAEAPAPVIDRPRPVGYRGVRRGWLDHVDRVETRNPATYRPYRPEYGHRQEGETVRGRSPSGPPPHARQPGYRLDATRPNRAETVATAASDGPPDGAIVNEAMPPQSEQSNRGAPQNIGHGQTPPYIYPPVPASSTVRPVRSFTTSATLTGPVADSLAAFETYRNYWSSEGNRQGRREERRGPRPRER